MQQPVTFIHITDLHLGTPDYEDTHLFSDTMANLEEALDLIDTVTPKPSFIIASGDLSNRGDAASYVALRQAMADVDLPVLYALGNHDTRPGFYEGMGIEAASPEAPYYYDTVIDGIHIIALDTSTPKAIIGTIEPEQFAWLEGVLDTHPELPKLIVAHHPPALGDAVDETPWRSIHVPHSERLAALLKGRNVLGILSGHIHHDRVSMWNGIPIIVGTGQHVATDILRKDVLRMVSGGSFGIGTVRPTGLTIAFVPLSPEREEVNIYPLERLRERAAAELAAASQVAAAAE